MMKQNIFSLTLLLGSLLTGGCVSTVDEPVADAAPISFATTMTRAAVDANKDGMESFLVWGASIARTTSLMPRPSHRKETMTEPAIGYRARHITSMRSIRQA